MSSQKTQKKPEGQSISLCMIAKNEERFISRAITSVRPVVNEVLVVDTGSRDNTPRIAKRLGARVIPYKWDGDLGRARNVYIKNASSEWILVLDADEAIAKKDLRKLKRLVNDAEVSGYIFTRRDYIKKHDLLRIWLPNDGKYPLEEKFSRCPGWSLTRCVRLFRKSKARYIEEKHSVHKDNVLLKRQRRRNGRVEDCDVIMHHFQYLKGEKAIERKQKEYMRRELKYIKTFPDNPWSHLNIAITLFNLKKDKAAIRYLKKALALNNRSAIAYFVLGMVYAEGGEYKKAASSLKRAVAIDPKYADAWTVLGMTYINLSRLQDAKRTLKKALTLHPQHLLAHNNLGIVYESLGRTRDAEREYRRAVKIHPEFTEARHNLATLYHSLGKMDRAREGYKSVLAINPADKEARGALEAVRRDKNRPR